MKSSPPEVHKWSVFGLLVLSSCSFTGSSYFIDADLESQNENSRTYRYDRMDEVKKECASVLSSAHELKPDDNRFYSIKNELSFMLGDWEQDPYEAPIMPFDNGGKILNTSLGFQSPINLVSFLVWDINQAYKSKKSISLSGSMYLYITTGGSSLPGRPYYRGAQFVIQPGHSELSVSFEGIYTESNKNNGEQVMCLLGNTMLPSRSPDSKDPWEWLKVTNYNYNQPPLLQDDQILLILRYPKTMTLTNREIKGEMKSLNPKSNLKFFDKIHISSRLGHSAEYQFESETLISKACQPYPYKDSFISSEIDFYNGSDYCSVLKRFQMRAFTLVPNWRCNGTAEFCSKMGPFESDKLIKARDGAFKDFGLLMQDVRCEMEHSLSQENVVTARVSAVFRVFTPSEDEYVASRRTGFNELTLSTEGIWDSSNRQLCMVGCLENNECETRVCLYIPISFSIKQRSIVFGSFSSFNGSSFPLLFEKFVQPLELWELGSSHLFYRYSKIDQAGAILEKNEPFNFGTIIKKSLMKYPKLEDTDAFLVSLSELSEDLTLHVLAVPDPIPNSRPPKIDTQLEILSLGPLFGRQWSYQNVTNIAKDTPYHTKAEYTEKQLLLNVSAQLRLIGNGMQYDNFSMLFLEGLYDPTFGKMYLFGCRDFRASWKILSESMDLENGLDCLIEVVISYPPTTARWLVTPTAGISITSQRNDDDPLHFSPIKVKTLPIMYRKQREDVLSRRGVEGIFRILTLSLAISSILSQLLYIRDHSDSLPFISFVMLGVQALGYTLPLVTGAEALFKKMASESYGKPSYNLETTEWFHVIDYTVKILVLVSFLLTLRLCQKVWKSRIRLLTRAPLERHRVPSDKMVLLATAVIHIIGYALVLITHSINTSQTLFRTERYLDSTGNSHTLRGWERELEEYVGLVQDLFLLPQIIGNFLWTINCKPLKKMYFLGLTVVRILPHLYDYLRAPVFNPYFSEEYEFVNPSFDFYSKFGDIFIVVIAGFLAVAVYIQQRWNYEELRQKLTFGSRVYERLPSKSFEAELVSAVSENATLERMQGEE